MLRILSSSSNLSRNCLALRAGHVKPELLHRNLLRVKLPHQLTLIHDKNPVGYVHYLIQLQGYEQHRFSAVPLRDKLAVNILDSSHIQPAGRLNRHKQLRISRAMMAFC